MAALLFLFYGCGGGDDDGRRLGEVIVGTWLRGWNEGDVVIEGNTEIKPEDVAYESFVFNDDGSYNGMVRKGTFTSYDIYGNIAIEGTYQCDNYNLKLTSSDDTGTILAQVTSFTDNTLSIKYTNEEFSITVSLIIRKQQ